MLAVVSSRAIVESFWDAMQENDWHPAAGHFTQDCEIDWPCSGERIVGRENFAAIQSRYPTNTGRWSFDVHRIVAEEDIVVSEVTVTDGEQAARVVAFLDSRRLPDRAPDRVLADGVRPSAWSRGFDAAHRSYPLKIEGGSQQFRGPPEHWPKGGVLSPETVR